MDKAFADLQSQIDAGTLADQFPVLEAVEEYAAKESWIVGLHTNNVALSQEFGSAAKAFESQTVNYTYGAALKDLIDWRQIYQQQGRFIFAEFRRLCDTGRRWTCY